MLFIPLKLRQQKRNTKTERLSCISWSDVDASLEGTIYFGKPNAPSQFPSSPDSLIRSCWHTELDLLWPSMMCLPLSLLVSKNTSSQAQNSVSVNFKLQDSATFRPTYAVPSASKLYWSEKRTLTTSLSLMKKFWAPAFLFYEYEQKQKKPHSVSQRHCGMNIVSS